MPLVCVLWTNTFDTAWNRTLIRFRGSTADVGPIVSLFHVLLEIGLAFGSVGTRLKMTSKSLWPTRVYVVVMTFKFLFRRPAQVKVLAADNRTLERARMSLEVLFEITRAQEVTTALLTDEGFGLHLIVFVMARKAVGLTKGLGELSRRIQRIGFKR